MQFPAPPPVESKTTPTFFFTSGVYALSSWHIPYLSTTLSFRDAAEFLHVASELPGSESINWKLSELYQRDIDWPRVERQIVPYLNSEDRPQFFNAITVALMPYDREKGDLLDFFEDGSSWTPPPTLNQDFANEMEIGPIRAGFIGEWDSIADPGARVGGLCWNPDEVFAVALDGQHRLASLKSLRGAHNTSTPKKHEVSRVPVIMLVFDERLGYRPPEKKPVVEVLRTVFIDLNKHARTVSRARQILLDDRDPFSICVRRLVGEEIRDGLSELEEPQPRLPLSLVDWHTEKAKFDEGPYLTTVLGLDWIVSQLLDCKPIPDKTAYSAIEKELKKLEKNLKVDLSKAKDRLEELETLMSPFTYHDEELAQIEKAFATQWTAPVNHLLTKFAPYAELIALRSKLSTFSTEYLSWYRTFEAKRQDKFEGRATTDYNRLLGRLSHREPPLSEKTLLGRLDQMEELKRDSLGFNVAFQRAVIGAYLEFVKIQDDDVIPYDEEQPDYPDMYPDEDGSGEDEDATAETVGASTNVRMTRAKQFTAILNRILDSFEGFVDIGGRFERENDDQEMEPDWFWLGSLRKAGGAIDFTQGASGRARELIFMCAAMVYFDDETEPDVESDFDHFWAEVSSGQSEHPLCKRVFKSLRRFADKDTSTGGRILDAKEREFDVDQSRDEAYYRLRWLWERMGL